MAEVHRVREKMAAAYNYDIKAMFADLQKCQLSLGDRLVLAKKRTESKTGIEEGLPRNQGFTEVRATPAT